MSFGEVKPRRRWLSMPFQLAKHRKNRPRIWNAATERSPQQWKLCSRVRHQSLKRYFGTRIGVGNETDTSRVGRSVRPAVSTSRSGVPLSYIFAANKP